jgi:hypothetical protein
MSSSSNGPGSKLVKINKLSLRCKPPRLLKLNFQLRNPRLASCQRGFRSLGPAAPVQGILRL